MKQKGYWLKGGITGLIVGPLVPFILNSASVSISERVINVPGEFMLLLAFYLFGGLAIIGFAVGSIVGLIYGKIKS